MTRSVNPFLLVKVLSPITGLADDDEAVDRFADLDTDDESTIRAFIRHEFRPFMRTLDPPTRERVRLALSYYLTKPAQDVRWSQLYESVLPPFDHPADPRDFFLWIWQECFPGQDHFLRDWKTYSEIPDPDEEQRLALARLDQAAQFVRSHNPKAQVIPALLRYEPIWARVPSRWHAIITGGISVNRLRETLAMWEDYHDELPSLFQRLSERLRTVYLVEGDSDMFLLYELEVDHGTVYMLGGDPSRSMMSLAATKGWNGLPKEFRSFYETVHNGWYDPSVPHVGLAPTEAFLTLIDTEANRTAVGTGIDVRHLLAVSTNGEGSYLLVNTATREPLLWPAGGSPRPLGDYWPLLDQWTGARKWERAQAQGKETDPPRSSGHGQGRSG